MRKTLNGRFKDPAWKADYCPEEAQRTYARSKAEAEQKAAEEQLIRNPWRPKVGVYATTGTNFND